MTFYTSKLRPYIVMVNAISNKDFWYGYRNGAILIPNETCISSFKVIARNKGTDTLRLRNVGITFIAHS